MTPSAEFSQELPIANSSQFGFPIGTAPASSMRATAVAVYGAIQCSRMLLPQVVRVFSRHMLSFTAIGTPAKRQIRAVAHALVNVTGVRFGEIAQQRQIGSDLALDISACAQRRSGYLGCANFTGIDVARDLGGAAHDSIFLVNALLRDDTGHAEERALTLRRAREHDLAVEATGEPIFARDVTRFDDLCGRRDARRIEFRERA